MTKDLIFEISPTDDMSDMDFLKSLVFFQTFYSRFRCTPDLFDIFIRMSTLLGSIDAGRVFYTFSFFVLEF